VVFDFFFDALQFQVELVFAILDGFVGGCHLLPDLFVTHAFLKRLFNLYLEKSIKFSN
jgi:hypothetical protein